MTYFLTHTMILENNETEVLEITEHVVKADNKRALIIHNDDYNTFDHVINTLIDVCKHNPIQAQQCTLIIHYNGKCEVKLGTLQELMPLRFAIQNRGISVTIE